MYERKDVTNDDDVISHTKARSQGGAGCTLRRLGKYTLCAKQGVVRYTCRQGSMWHRECLLRAHRNDRTPLYFVAVVHSGPSPF